MESGQQCHPPPALPNKGRESCLVSWLWAKQPTEHPDVLHDVIDCAYTRTMYTYTYAEYCSVHHPLQLLPPPSVQFPLFLFLIARSSMNGGEDDGGDRLKERGEKRLTDHEKKGEEERGPATNQPTLFLWGTSRRRKKKRRISSSGAFFFSSSSPRPLPVSFCLPPLFWVA